MITGPGFSFVMGPKTEEPPSSLHRAHFSLQLVTRKHSVDPSYYVVGQIKSIFQNNLSPVDHHILENDVQVVLFKKRYIIHLKIQDSCLKLFFKGELE